MISIAALVVFVKVCTGIVEVPEVVTPLMPIGCDADQLKVTPVVREDKVTDWVDCSEQIFCFKSENFTSGAGFTVMLKLFSVPGQLLAVGVTFIVATTGEDPLFNAVNEAMLPFPGEDNPIDVRELVQLYTTPATPFPEKFIAVVVLPLHTT